MHKVHYQPKKIVSVDGVKREAQYGCYNFVYREFIFGPVTTY